MDALVVKYLAGLKQAYINNNAQESWEHFESIKHGAASENITALKALYPDIPDALIGLLEYADGTYFREYAGEKVLLFFLGSDVEEYPYYLLSSQEMIDNQHIGVEYYSDFIVREFEEAEIDDRITNKTDGLKWLHFSDCMNNGGTSQLFIDFSPSPKGKSGQVIRFLHDPDSLIVIADSFEEYLNYLMANKYDFIDEETLD